MKYTTALFQTIAATAFRLLSLPIEITSAFVPTRASVASLLNRNSSSSGSDEDSQNEKAEPASHSSFQETTTTKKKKNPIDVFGIDHVVLLVEDLEGTTEWYRTVLGCTVAKRNEKFQMVHLDAGSALIDLVDRAGPLGNNNIGDNDSNSNNNGDRLGHLCLGLRDFDEAAIRAHLEEHGVSVTTDLGVRFGKNGYGESLYFRDPEGTEIEIRKSLLL